MRLALRHALSAVPDARIALVHDAARAFTPPEVVARVVDAVAAGAPAVVPVLPVADTVKLVDAGGVVLIGFRLSSLMGAESTRRARGSDSVTAPAASPVAPGPTAIPSAARH